MDSTKKSVGYIYIYFKPEILLMEFRLRCVLSFPSSSFPATAVSFLHAMGLGGGGGGSDDPLMPTDHFVFFFFLLQDPSSPEAHALRKTIHSPSSARSSSSSPHTPSPAILTLVTQRLRHLPRSAVTPWATRNFMSSFPIFYFNSDTHSPGAT